MLSASIHLAIAACAIGGAVPPSATRTAGHAIDLRTLERLDETRQDIGPLRTSLAMQPTDLRQPLGFDHVYRLPGGEDGSERLARISGGLAAVFPRSTYRTTEKGQLALVPPGTIFYLGSLPAGSAPSPAVSAAIHDLRYPSQRTEAGDVERVLGIDTRVSDSPQATPPQVVMTEKAPRGIMTDEAYRATRVRTLLQMAATQSQVSR